MTLLLIIASETHERETLTAQVVISGHLSGHPPHIWVRVWPSSANVRTQTLGGRGHRKLSNQIIEPKSHLVDN